jgi:putative hydrolase of the HAD superfamily
MIKWVLFDFGGVIAEEGFRKGLEAIAGENGLDAGQFVSIANELMYVTGYVVGQVDEHAYWGAVRRATLVKGTDGELRERILPRFVLRQAMLDEVARLRSRGFRVGILSDQTDWLDEIDDRSPFKSLFDRVFNSYYLKRSKRDTGLFRAIAAEIGAAPWEILFVDDNEGNAARATSQDWNTIVFRGVDRFTLEAQEVIDKAALVKSQ